MRMLHLAYANLKANFLTTALSVILLAIGVGMVSFISSVSDQLNERFGRDIRGVDMVVGAKGSPLQLILSAVYQIDNPTGNIKLDEAMRIVRHPLVKYCIPLSYGDSYMGFRIVGTDTFYLRHFQTSFATGSVWKNSMDVVLGSAAAQQLGLGVGAHFHGTHGFDTEGHEHEEAHYTVVGILNPSGTVADRLILTSTASVWDMHAHAEESGVDSLDHHEEEKELTAMMVKFKSPMGIMQIPRFVNENTNMQAAIPAIEINRLYGLMGIGFSTLKIIGVIMMLIAAMSVFISLLNSLKERKYELALMRSLGASPSKLFALVLQESLLLCVIGFAFGIVLGRVGIMVLSSYGQDQFHFGISQSGIAEIELILLPATLLVGLAAAIIPAIEAYRADISSVLRNE